MPTRNKNEFQFRLERVGLQPNPESTRQDLRHNLVGKCLNADTESFGPDVVSACKHLAMNEAQRVPNSRQLQLPFGLAQ